MARTKQAPRRDGGIRPLGDKLLTIKKRAQAQSERGGGLVPTALSAAGTPRAPAAGTPCAGGPMFSFSVPVQAPA